MVLCVVNLLIEVQQLLDSGYSHLERECTHLFVFGGCLCGAHGG